MLRSLACTIAVVLLAACGSSSSSSAPAPAPEPALAGTVAGQSFVPADSSALTLGQATCSFSGTNATATGLLIGFGSFSGLCDLATSTKGCGSKQSATVVNLLVVRANVANGTPGAVQPGTYTVGSTTPLPDPSGNVSVATAFIDKTDPQCASSSTPLATSGTIKIGTVSPHVTGSADLTFDDGSHVAGSFDAALCGFQTDVCTALSSSACTSHSCVP